ARKANASWDVFPLPVHEKYRTEWHTATLEGHFDNTEGRPLLTWECRVAATGEETYHEVNRNGLGSGNGYGHVDISSYGFEVPAGSKLILSNIKLKGSQPSFSIWWVIALVCVVVIFGGGVLWVIFRRRRSKAQRTAV